MYLVYILKCADGSLYTGITTDLERRFKEHRAGTASHYTAARKALKMCYAEKAHDRSTALKREAQIKSWPRERKLALIAGGKSPKP